MKIQMNDTLLIRTIAVISIALFSLTWFGAESAPNYAINFLINSNGDQSDLVLNDGLCNTANNNCTLRAALEEAFVSQAGYVITFASNMTITPTSPLPAIERDDITISGVGRTIILDGSQAGLTASGIWLKGSSSHIIQGLTIRNWGRSGILIDGAGGVAQNNLIGTNGDGNDDANERVILEDNFAYGIEITGAFAMNNVVAGNQVGSTARPNQTGVAIRDGANNNLIGTNGDGIADTAERNLIRGNSVNGIALHNADRNTIAGNYIGLEANGSSPAGNGGGITLDAGSNFNLIGTDGDGSGDSDERNVISSSYGLSGGLRIQASIGNTVAGNYIGTDSNGTSARGNLFRGVTLSNGANGNIIGTNGDGSGDDHEGNLISANGSSSGFKGGLVLLGVQRNIIAGNFVGTNAAGTAALGNDGAGIVLAAGAHTNIVGTKKDGISDTLEGNLISGNSAQGISISGHFNAVSGNKIGTDLTGTKSIGNGLQGIQLLSIQGSDASHNLIGGSSSVQANVVAHNGSEAIRIEGVSGVAPVDNLILTNSIFSNDALGINLASALDPVNGVTPNDSKDLDTGSNDLMNAPEIITAVSFGSKTYGEVQISNGLRNSNFHIQFFSNTECDPSGFGEGQTFIGQVRLSTDAFGNASSGMVAFDGATPLGDSLTATATLHEGQLIATSEFSACKEVLSNVILAPACSIKDSLFNLQERPLQSAALLGLTLSIFVVIGLGLGALLERRLGGGNQVMARRMGGVVGGFLGLVLLGFVSQVPSCQPPIALDPPGGSSSIVTLPQETPEMTTPTATEESTATFTPTPTPTEQQECTYTALVNLFCRVGPGSGYKEIDTFTAGQSAPILGMSLDGYYWYVKGPNNDSLCTVPDGAQYGQITGDCAVIPAFTPIPLPSATPTSTPTCTPGVVGC